MEPGFILGQYVFVEPLGEGGMAEVWKGRHSRLDYEVAIKFLKPQFAHDRDLQERFLNEGRRQANLDHPNIVRAIDFISEGGRNFLVMKYVAGGGLDRRIEEAHGPLPLEEALNVSFQVLSALRSAHRQGVIHRDVKPSNVLLDAEGRCYLTDFGIALAVGQQRFTRTGTVMGTDYYMSPEQIRSPHTVDHRSDIYSFGVVLFEMLTGVVPFDYENEFLLKQAHVEQAPPKPSKLNPSIGKAIEAVVLRALAKNPDDRWGDCEAMSEALEVARTGALPPFRKTRPQDMPTLDSEPMHRAEPVRILQRPSGIGKQLGDETSRDRANARRLVREAEDISDPVTLREYSDRLGELAERHPADPELQEIVRPFLRRLQTISDERESIEGGAADDVTPLPDGQRDVQRRNFWTRVRDLRVKSMPKISMRAAMAVLALLLVSLIAWGITARVHRSRLLAKAAVPAVTPPVEPSIPEPPPAPAPELQSLSISGDSAYITLDHRTDERKLLAPGEDFHGELQDGEHTVEVLVTLTQRLSFVLRAQPDAPAGVAMLQAQNLPVVIVSSNGRKGRIYASPALTLRFNGTSLGTVGEAGQDLPAVDEDKQTLQVDIGNSTVLKALVFPPGRAVSVLLKPDASLGGLVVKSTPDEVRLTLTDATGKALSGVTRSGKYQFSNLKPGAYTLVAAKGGFISTQETITILAAKDVNRDLTLAPVPVSAIVTIRTRPGASIAIVGERTLGTVPTSGILVVQDLPARSTTFAARLAGYQDSERSVELKAGDNGIIEIPLNDRAPGILKIRRSPADSTVTYQRSGDSAPRNVSGDSMALPEGAYTLRAQANGFETRINTVTLRAGETTEVDLTLAPKVTDTKATKVQPPVVSWNPSIWTTEKDGSHIHKMKGLAFLGPTPGSYQFTANPLGSKLEWVIGYKDASNYIRCEIEGSSYSSWLVRGGKTIELKKAAKLMKQDWYRVSVMVADNRMTVQVFEDGRWKPLDDRIDLPAGVSEGQFGFKDLVTVYEN